MTAIFDSGIFDSGIFKTGAPGTFDTGIFDRNIFDNILGPISSSQTLGGGPGFALSFRQERDWDKVRKARDEIRTALEEATTGPRKQRKEAARKAALAIEEVLAVIRTPGSSGAWADVLLDLEGLMASLGAMMEAERIRVEEARRAAAEWARIEAEFRMQQFLEEELLVVLALAS